MGHEFCGTIHEIGSNIQRHAVGDPVFSPFTTCCGSCFYCQNGLSSRCESGQLYGTADLPGTQAEYVRVPLADATLRAEPVGLLRNVMPLLLADVFPTGYHAATSAFDMIPRGVVGSAYENVVIVGCGPVGLSAVVTTTHLDSKVYKPKQIFAADTVPSRLALAEAMGAQPLNTSAGTDKAVKAVREATQGRGADIIVELVGMKLALRMAFDMLRPGGILVSLGVHDEEFPWSLAEGRPFSWLNEFLNATCTVVGEHSIDPTDSLSFVFQPMTRTCACSLAAALSGPSRSQHSTCS